MSERELVKRYVLRDGSGRKVIDAADYDALEETHNGALVLLVEEKEARMTLERECERLRSELKESEESGAAMSAELTECCDARWDMECGGLITNSKPCQFYAAKIAQLRERLAHTERELDLLYRVALSEMSAFVIHERLAAAREGKS